MCSPPVEGMNTQIIRKSNSYKVGDNYTYECQKHYMYDGDIVSTCLSNLTWSLSPPTCVGETYIAI